MSRVLKLILGATLVGQAVMAQPGGPAPIALPPPGGAPPASDADISVRQRSTLSPTDMSNQARDYRARMDQISKQVQGLIDKARQAKDVIRLNCLIDKFATLKANIGVADKALQDLQDAINRHDDAGSSHEYIRITIVHQKAGVLGAESQACVGEDLSYVGATRVEVEQPYGDINPTGPAGFMPTDVGSLDHDVDRPPQATPSS
jgi:flagellar hook-associated protein FlgK